MPSVTLNLNASPAVYLHEAQLMLALEEPRRGCLR